MEGMISALPFRMWHPWGPCGDLEGEGGVGGEDDGVLLVGIHSVAKRTLRHVLAVLCAEVACEIGGDEWNAGPPPLAEPIRLQGTAVHPIQGEGGGKQGGIEEEKRGETPKYEAPQLYIGVKISRTSEDLYFGGIIYTPREEALYFGRGLYYLFVTKLNLPSPQKEGVPRVWERLLWWEE